MSIRVAIVDDHPSITWGLERLIASEAPRMQSVGVAHTLQDALELLLSTPADVVLLDLDIDGHSGLDLIVRLKGSNLRFLAFTGVRDERVVDAAIRAGARGVVSKHAQPETLIRAISRVHDGELWLDRAKVGRLVDNLREPARAIDPFGRLTPREREIVALMVTRSDAPSKRLADELGITESTLRNALSVIYSKVGIGNRLQLFALASSIGWPQRTL